MMDADKIPMLGFGTYNGESDESARKMYDATRTALKAGYRRYNLRALSGFICDSGLSMFERDL